MFYFFQEHFNVGTVSSPVSLPGFTGNPSVTESSTVSAVPTPASLVSNDQIVKLDVPFTTQAPFGEWSDLRQEDGCEEIAVIMAVSWAQGHSLSPQEAKDKILAISDWEQKNYGTYQDTSARDTVDRIFKGYFNYQKVDIVDNITSPQAILSELEKGNLVIVPVNGRLLSNPFYRPPGPERHMIVVIGYDYQTQEFITNDTGTKHGQDYRYGQDALFSAIRDYTTGDNQPIVGVQKVMIVVKK